MLIHLLVAFAAADSLIAGLGPFDSGYFASNRFCVDVLKKRGLDTATASMKPTGCYKRPIFSKTPENQDPAKDIGK